MGVFSNFKNAKATGGSRNYLKHGEHDIRVTNAKFDTSRKGVNFFAMEGVVESTDSTDPTMQPGQRVNWSTHADKDAYEGNVKQFFMAAFNFNEQQVEEMSEEDFDTAMDEMTGSQQAAVGRLMHASCRDTVSKENNNYVATQWLGVPEDQQAPGSAVEE